MCPEGELNPNHCSTIGAMQAGLYTLYFMKNILSGSLFWTSQQPWEEKLKSICISSLTFQRRKLMLNGINILKTARNLLGQILRFKIPFSFLLYFTTQQLKNCSVMVTFICPRSGRLWLFCFHHLPVWIAIPYVAVHLILCPIWVQLFVNTLFHYFVM